MPRREKKRVLIVDGYNVLNAWRTAKGKPLADGRDELIDRLKDYAGYSGQEVTIVFDAWQSDRKMRTIESSGPVSVVFTQRGETADHYIERLCDGYAQEVDRERMELRVATSDGVEQTVVLGRGAMRLSARELLSEMDAMRSAGRAHSGAQATRRSSIMDGLSDDVRAKLEQMRRSKS